MSIQPETPYTLSMKNRNWWIYKVIKYSIMKVSYLLLIAIIAVSTNVSFAQVSDSVELIGGKTKEQIVNEYKSWSGMKNDWANLARYQEENSVLEAPKKREKRVVFMGNSITQGWKRQRPEFFELNPYICRGISGQTTPQMLLRFRQDVIDLKPDVVVILAGTNDIAGNTGPSTLDMITGNIFSMIELAQANNIKVVLCSVLPANEYRWRPEVKPADTIIELNRLLESYAKKNKIPYVDYFSPMVDKEKGLKKEYSGDGVHPNQKGYTVMEPLIKNEIDKVLKKG